MNNFVLQTYQELLNSIREIPQLKKLPVKNPTLVAGTVNTAIERLREHFGLNPFADCNAEIDFFKYEKPKFYSECIYAAELFTIESNRPHADETVVRNYYELELRFVKRFFDQYRFLYQYYLLDGAELDQIYFTAGNKDFDQVLPEAPDANPDFSAPADFLFAKFLALEKLQDHLISILYPTGRTNKPNEIMPQFRWTGDKINLVELAYGIYNTAQVNDGEVHIGDIISWLEASFSIKLTRYFQMFSEIKGRKSVSKTRYLDHMGKMINRHIELGDAFVPEKPRSVSGSKPADNK